MSYRWNIINKSYANRAALYAEIWTEIEAMGWELHDDRSGSSYKVYKSNGESGNLLYQYIKIDWITANKITYTPYYYWNSATHTGLGKASSYSTNTTSESGFYGWIYGNKDGFAVLTKVSTTYYMSFVTFVTKKASNIETTLTAGASSGSHFSLTVGSTAKIGRAHV